MPNVHYAFLDESSSLGSQDDYFALALLLANPQQQKHLNRLTRRIRRTFLNKSQELKFYKTTPRIRNKLLDKLAHYEIKVIVLAVKKEERHIADTPQNYGLIVGYAAALCLNATRRSLNLIVDKKYTSRKYRTIFDQKVAETVSFLAPDGHLMRPVHSESYRDRLIQLADFIAGAANQKYNRSNSSYLDLVQEKIIIEKVISWRELRGEFKTKKAAFPGRR